MLISTIDTESSIPFAVGSPILPGAKVPDLSASVGSPPIAAIWAANSRAMALFSAAAPALAGSY